MNAKVCFSLTLDDKSAADFMLVKQRLGWEFASNTAALKMLISMVAKNPAGAANAIAASPAVDTKEEKARKQREGWVAFARIHNANDGKWHDYWDYRSELVRKFVDPSKEETQQQVDYRMREAAKFVLDWEAWTAGEFDGDGELPPYQSGEK